MNLVDSLGAVGSPTVETADAGEATPSASPAEFDRAAEPIDAAAADALSRANWHLRKLGGIRQQQADLKEIKRLLVGFDKLGLPERRERLELLTHIIGRPIATSKDLTKVEASQAIERIIEVEEGRAAITFGEAGAPIIVEIETKGETE